MLGRIRTCGKTRETDRQTRTELDETGVQGQLLLQAGRDKDGNDETVDGNNTSHNDRYDV